MNKKLSRIYLLATFTVALLYNQSIVAQSLSFDGEDDYVNIGRPLSLDAGNAGSSALWFKITSSGDYSALFTNDTERFIA